MDRTGRGRSQDTIPDGVVGPTATDPDVVQMAVGSVASRASVGPADPEDRRPSGRRSAAALVLAAILALLVVVAVRDDHAPATMPASPTSAVLARWSVVVPDAPVVASVNPGRATLDPTIEIVGGEVLHTVRSRAGRVRTMYQRSVATGEVGWERAFAVGTQPVVVSSAGRVVGGPTGQWLTATSGSRSLVGVSLADGTSLWEEPIDDDFVGWVDPGGALFVSGNAQCGYLDPSSGRLLFLEAARECLPASDGMAFATPDGWVVVTAHGQRVAAVGGGMVPRLVGDRVVTTRGDDIVLIGRDGREEVVPAPALDRLADHALDANHVAGWAGEEQFIVDLSTPRVVGPYSPAARPVVVDDTLRIIDDGTFPVPDLVASGVWSRSPDANLVRTLDAAGDVLATREMVLAPPMLPTADGILLWEQVGTASTLGLYGYDDLEPRWEASFRGTPLAGIASSGELVVASYLDAQGRVRLVGLGPG